MKLLLTLLLPAPLMAQSALTTPQYIQVCTAGAQPNKLNRTCVALGAATGQPAGLQITWETPS